MNNSYIRGNFGSFIYRPLFNLPEFEKWSFEELSIFLSVSNRSVRVIEIYTIDKKLKGGLKIEMAHNSFGLFLVCRNLERTDEIRNYWVVTK